MTKILLLLLLFVNSAALAQNSYSDSLLVQKQMSRYKSNKAVGGILALLGVGMAVIPMTSKVEPLFSFGDNGGGGMSLGTAAGLTLGGLALFVTGSIVYIVGDSKLRNLKKRMAVSYNDGALNMDGRTLVKSAHQLSLIIQLR
jgi:hypothetical protein